MDAAVDLPPLQVELRLHPTPGSAGAVHVAGTVTPTDGAPRPFDGWLALLQVLEALLEGEG